LMLCLIQGTADSCGLNDLSQHHMPADSWLCRVWMVARTARHEKLRRRVKELPVGPASTLEGMIHPSSKFELQTHMCCIAGLLHCRMDGSFARIQHANPWIALPYRCVAQPVEPYSWSMNRGVSAWSLLGCCCVAQVHHLSCSLTCTKNARILHSEPLPNSHPLYCLTPWHSEHLQACSTLSSELPTHAALRICLNMLHCACGGVECQQTTHS
jgi:hypothetical protein